jgi:steroid delta-isomerase-like uncharacterized protein
MAPITPQADHVTSVALRFVELVDQQRFEEVDAMLTPEFQLCFSGQQLDRTQTMTLIRDVYRAFPDFRHDVQEAFAAGDRVVVRFIDRGTHSDVFEGLPASGRTFAIGQISIFRIVDDRIAEIREEADMLGLMQQLGAIP